LEELFGNCLLDVNIELFRYGREQDEHIRDLVSEPAPVTNPRAALSFDMAFCRSQSSVTNPTLDAGYVRIEDR
jgi:hypothetical protein